MSQYTKLISLDEILRHPEKLVGQPASEIAETKIACAAVSAALAACEPNTALSAAPDLPNLLNAAQAAAYLGVHESFIREKGRQGELLSVRVGRYVRFERSALDQFAARRKHGSGH